MDPENSWYEWYESYKGEQDDKTLVEEASGGAASYPVTPVVEHEASGGDRAPTNETLRREVSSLAQAVQAMQTMQVMQSTQ